MFKLTLFVFLAMISKGYFQEWNNSPPNYSDRRSDLVQINYDAPKLRTKPCPNRRNNVDSRGWIPLFQPKSNIFYPEYPVQNDPILEPQALKNENIQDKYDEVSAPPDISNKPTNSAADNVNDKELNSVIVLPPSPIRRSNSYPRSNFEELVKDYDCDADLDTNGNPDSNLQTKESPVNSRRSNGIEQKVVEMLNECISKNKKNKLDRVKLVGESPILYSRRFLKDSDASSKNATDLLEENLQYSGDSNSNAGLNGDSGVNNGEYISDDVPFKIEKVQISVPAGILYNNLQNPTIGPGIAELHASRRMTESSRVCYACSTATNPSCWEPDSRTTVKYCRQEHNCLTKTFPGLNDSITLIRDCAVDCNSGNVNGIEPKYKSCSICHKDLCNSAIANSYSLVIVFLIAIKCTF